MVGGRRVRARGRLAGTNVESPPSAFAGFEFRVVKRISDLDV